MRRVASFVWANVGMRKVVGKTLYGIISACFRICALRSTDDEVELASLSDVSAGIAAYGL